jgi:7-cyano-7-deazaguanine synthase
MKPSERALVILSGGQDSTTALFWAINRFKEVHAITFDYGQRHRLEIQAATKVAEMAGVASHHLVDIQGILRSSSPLVSNTELEEYTSFHQMDKEIGNRVELTFVPMRNTLFFTVAANRAVARKIENLVTGICQEDNANYPDCTEGFRAAFEEMMNLSLGVEKRFLLHAPLINFSKAETVRLSSVLPGCWDALAYTHTSYDGLYPPTGMNHANVLRAHGFEEAGLPDPLVLRAWREGLMPLPSTKNYTSYQPEQGK